MTPVPTGVGDALAVELDISGLECKTLNAIEKVECTDWEVMCKPGENFFFRLATFGEVYELATKTSMNGTDLFEPAVNGMIPCDDITKDPVSGEIEGLYIYNRHMSEFTELNKFFEFEIEEVELSVSNTYEDLECTSPISVLPTY